jgi:hypothetical protein
MSKSERITECLAQFQPTGAAVSGRNSTHSDARVRSNENHSINDKLPENQGFNASGRDSTQSDIISGDRTRTCDLQVMNPSNARRKDKTVNHLRLLTSDLASPLHRARSIDPDLDELIRAWPGMPDVAKAGIVAMVQGVMESMGDKSG